MTETDTRLRLPRQALDITQMKVTRAREQGNNLQRLAMVKVSTRSNRPRGATMRPTEPSTIAGRARRAPRAARMACFAQASAPRMSVDTPPAAAAASACTANAGSSTSSSFVASPKRSAARNFSTRECCWASSSSGRVETPRTRRRARLASCRAASGERPVIRAISSNGKSKRSCSTKAIR